MSEKWIAVITGILLCLTQSAMAQTPVHHKHKSLIKHKHITHKSKHSVSHKPKHTQTIVRADKTDPSDTQFSQADSANFTNQKLVSQQIPLPQFDTNYSINTNSINDWQNISMPAAPAPDSIDTSNQTLTTLAYRTVENLHYSHYKLGANVFNPTAGIYKIDCSGYINDLLSKANPQAYTTLTDSTQTAKPTTKDYYNFITRLPIDEVRNYWRRITNVEQLQPGGILVFRSIGRYHRSAGGHVMLVMSKPIPHPTAADTYQIKVADSAPSGHSDDTRLPHQSGIGIGTMLVKVDPVTGKPEAYAWKLNDHWRSNAVFAMAQPSDATQLE